MICRSSWLRRASLLYCQRAHKILRALLSFTPSFTFDIFQLIAKEIITFLLIFTPSLRMTFISRNYHIPFNFYTVFMFHIHFNLLSDKLSHSF